MKAGPVPETTQSVAFRQSGLGMARDKPHVCYHNGAGHPSLCKVFSRPLGTALRCLLAQGWPWEESKSPQSCPTGLPPLVILYYITS